MDDELKGAPFMRREVIVLASICILLLGLAGGLAVGWNAEHESYKNHKQFYECREQCGEVEAIILEGQCKCVYEPLSAEGYGS